MKRIILLAFAVAAPLVAGAANAQTFSRDPNIRLCDAVNAAADQLERNAHYLVAERGNALDMNDKIKGAFVPKTGEAALAIIVGDNNTQRASQYAAVSKDDFNIAHLLRLEAGRSCLGASPSRAP